MGYVVVCWPESQMLMENEGFFENCTLINTERGLEAYGSSAYLVDENWYDQFQKGELAPMSEDEWEEWENREDEWGVVDDTEVDRILFGDTDDE